MSLHTMSMVYPPPDITPDSRSGIPLSVTVSTHGDVIGSTRNTPVVNPVGIARYINRNVGGSTGVTNFQGFTSGMVPWRSRRMSGVTVVPPHSNVTGNVGPVGRSNWAGNVRSGVASMFSEPQSLEDIYRSMTGG